MDDNTDSMAYRDAANIRNTIEPLSGTIRLTSTISPLSEKEGNISYDHSTPSTDKEDWDRRVGRRHHLRNASMGHRRRPSSISLADPAMSTLRTSPAMSTALSPLHPSAIIDDKHQNQQHTTSRLARIGGESEGGRDDSARDRLVGFTFARGATAASSPHLSHPSQSSSSMRSRPSSQLHTPEPSLSDRRPITLLSDSSRPPSLLVTRPPIPAEAETDEFPTASPRSTSARVRKHSHTRSNSISLPNLKVGRPTSLGFSPVFSFPSSPVSPDENTPPPSSPRVSNGRRLKFEPSGRGAEAEKQKEESRRKALEKLTGVNSTSHADESLNQGVQPAQQSIELPGEDEDMTPPFFNQLVDPYRGNIGSDLVIQPYEGSSPPVASPSSSSSLVPSAGSALPLNPRSLVRSLPTFRDDTLGIDLSASAKRVSVTSALGVLAEEDEGESALATVSDHASLNHNEGIKPTPTRLRQLHLLSSPSIDSPSNSRSPAGHHASTTHDDLTSPPARSSEAAHSARYRPSPLHRTRSDENDGLSLMSPRGSRETESPLNPHRRRQSRGSLSYKSDRPTRDDIGSSGTLSVDEVVTPIPSGFALPSPSNSMVSNWSADPLDYRNHPWPSWSQSTQRPRWSAQAQSVTLPPFPTTLAPANDEVNDDRCQGYPLGASEHHDGGQDDLDMWYKRCMAAEEKLGAERKEKAVLQARIRKLGDRLSSVSSIASPARHESTISTELRQQLFSTAAQLDRERREKADALARVAELEHKLVSLSTSIAQPSPPLLPSQRSSDIYQTQAPTSHPSAVAPSVATASYPLPTPPTSTRSLPPSVLAAPSAEPTEDLNAHRIKAWGFPPPPRQKSPLKDRKRESFFGLSAAVTPSIEHGGFAGIDLPPFAPTQPTPDSSVVSVASAGGYSFSDEKAIEPVVQVQSQHLLPTLDLTHTCKCCTGEIFNL